MKTILKCSIITTNGAKIEEVFLLSEANLIKGFKKDHKSVLVKPSRVDNTTFSLLFGSTRLAI